MRVRLVVGAGLLAAPLFVMFLLAVAAVPASSSAIDAAGGTGARRASAVRHAWPASLPYVPGELIVQFRRGVGATDRARSVRRAGCVVAQVLPGVAGPAGRTTLLVRSGEAGTRDLAAQFSADPAVAAVAPNGIRRIDAAPLDDPGIPQQWGLAAIGVIDAWEITTGSPDVVVASIDTGVDVFHPDLAANIWHNPGEVAGNGVDDDGNGYVDDVYGIDAANGDVYPFDDQGHGTHTSGIMAAVGDNGQGIAGVSWRTSVMALKFIDDGWGTDAAAIECIDYVVRERVEHGVNVVAINASWGGEIDSLVMRNAIKAAGDAGIVFCASAGNDASNADLWSHFPSSFDCPNIISVCATNGERLAGFSNWGACTVDVGAPGQSVLSTVNEGRYAHMSGTSMAAPAVTGTVALLAARYPDESAYERVARIVGTVRPKPWLEGLCMSGGVLDPAAALGLGDPATDTTAPATTAVGLPAGLAETGVTVRLHASDGAGGSGVAATEWRLDGGRWIAGTSASVPAPIDAVQARTLEFRSTDRAGNVEDVKAVVVAFDTTAKADDALPGVRLPAAPVTGVARRPSDKVDIYRVRLEKGQTLKLSPADPLRAGFSLSVDAPGRASGTWWMELRRLWPLTYQAPVAGRYYLRVSNGPYAFAYSVHAPGEDVRPPGVSVDLSREYWSNVPVTVSCTVWDEKGGSGAGPSEISLDEGLTWTPLAQVVIDAPADHSNDGVHRVLARGVDLAGNASLVRPCDVHIDTEGPATRAWGPLDPVRTGARARVYFDVDDLAESIYCVLIVRSAATGKVVHREDAGWHSGTTFLPSPWDKYPFLARIAWRCDLPAGEYNVFIAGGTHDGAGNRWVSATCERPLVVE